MERTAIISKTGMTGYAYNAQAEVLEIAFKPKNAGEPEKVYHYTPFKAADWQAFQAAASKGSHFLKVIRPHFACAKAPQEVHS